MNLIQPKYEIINQDSGINGIYKAIELPGRICYHSQDKITETSAKPFVERLMQANHGAPLEHGTVYLYLWFDSSNIDSKLDYPANKYFKSSDRREIITYLMSRYKTNQYTHVNTKFTKENNNRFEVFITTNFRVLFENGWLDDLIFISDPLEGHEKRVMVKFTLDRFTGEEYLRHRKGSFNRESTRYINYTKDRHGNGSIDFILPPWIDDKEKDRISDKDYFNAKRNEFNQEETDKWEAIDVWLFTLKTSEWAYNTLVTQFNWQPQQARTVLPCAISSPLIVTMFVKDWKHFFNLRAKGTTGAPHPQAKELAEPLMNEFIEKGLITEPF